MWTAAKRVLRYLKATKDYAIRFKAKSGRKSGRRTAAFVDSCHADDKDKKTLPMWSYTLLQQFSNSLEDRVAKEKGPIHRRSRVPSGNNLHKRRSVAEKSALRNRQGGKASDGALRRQQSVYKYDRESGHLRTQ